MHWLDSTLLVLLALGAGFGFFSGLLWQVARVASLGIALWATLFFHDQALSLVQDHLLREADPGLAAVVAYTAAFLVVYLVLLLVTRFIKKLVHASGLAWMDRCLGAGLGTMKTAAVLGGVCLMMSRASNPSIRDWMEKSAIAPNLAGGMENALALIPDEYRQTVADSIVTLRAKVEEQ